MSYNNLSFLNLSMSFVQFNNSSKKKYYQSLFLLLFYGSLLSSFFISDVSCGLFNLPDSPYRAKLNLPPVAAGILLLVGGFLFLFFGVKLFKPILFLSGLAIGSLVSYTILINVEKSHPNLGGNYKDYLFLLLPLIIGLLLGVLFLYILRLGIIAIGALGGFSLSLFILSWKTGSLIQSDVIRPIFITVLVIIGSILTVFFEKEFIIIATSIFGAGALCAGIDIFAATGFCHALDYILSHRGTFILNDKLIGILISYALLACFGIFMQFKFHKNSSLFFKKSSFKKRSKGKESGSEANE